MNYPPLDIEAALNGEPVVYLSYTGEKKAYIHQMRAADQLFIEYEKGDAVCVDGFYTSKNIDSVVLGMWAEPVVFEHWELISPEIEIIEKVTANVWTFHTKSNSFNHVYGKNFVYGFFPDCPNGTVIRRPE